MALIDLCIITSRPVDPNMLAELYKDCGKVDFYNGGWNLYCDIDFGVSFNFEFFEDDGHQDLTYFGYSEAEQVLIYRTFATPYQIGLECSTEALADLVIGRLQIDENSLVQTTRGGFLTLGEIRQFIKHRVEWAWWDLGDGPELIIDLDGSQQNFVLVIMEDRYLINPAIRELLLQRQLQLCGKSVHRIEVVCEQPPTSKMEALRERYLNDPSLPRLDIELTTPEAFRARYGFVPRDFPSLRDA